MRSEQTFQRCVIGRINVNRFCEHFQRFIACGARQQVLTCFGKADCRFRSQALSQIAFRELGSNLSVGRIEIRYFSQHCQTLLRRAGFSVRLCYEEIMRARFNHQILTRVQVGEVGRNFGIVRLQTIDLLVHRDRLQDEILCAIVFGDVTKTGNRRRLIADARI